MVYSDDKEFNEGVFRDGVELLTKYLNWEAIVKDAKSNYDAMLSREEDEGTVEEEVESILDEIRFHLSADDTRVSVTIEQFVEDNTVKQIQE